jgi:hypothetical protein
VNDVAANEATVRVRNGPLVGAVLGRGVGLLAARADCPIDRLDDALLLTDAVAAHAPAHAVDGCVVVLIRTEQDGIELRVGPLAKDGAQRLLADAALPGVGNVFEQVADAVEAGADPDGGGEQLIIRLGFAR